MQYLVIGYDGDDDKALDRRMAARQAHIALGERMKAEGKMLYGVAILDEREKMAGSVLICDFDSRARLDEWLKIEPYVTSGVWKKIEVKQCRVGPSFSTNKNRVGGV